MKINRKKICLNVDEIKEILPHRQPFLLVDRILEMGRDYAIGTKAVSVNEPFFAGHFPNCSIMPGHLISESMAQVSVFAAHSIETLRETSSELNNNISGFLAHSNVKFYQPIIPGDLIIIKSEKKQYSQGLNIFFCQASVDDIVMAKGEIKIHHIVKKIKQ